MKKLLLILVAIAMLFAFSCASLPEKSQPLESHLGYEAYIRTTEIKLPEWDEEGRYSEKIIEEYFIYVGNEESEAMDEQVASMGFMIELTLFQPVEGVEMPYEAPKGWYAQMVDNRYNVNMMGILLSHEVWSTIPPIMKHVLIALDPDDEDLLVLKLKYVSGGIIVLYHPDYNQKKRFYQKKLAKLIKYFETHDLIKDIPLKDILPTEV